MRHLLKFSLFLITGLMAFSCNKDKEKGQEPQEQEGIVINGVRWAASNVDTPGVFTASPEDMGMLYQWNRRVGWSSTDPMINSDGGTQWDDTYPPGDWNPENDPCPCGWRMPEMKELQSLEKSNHYSGELNGVAGCFFGDNDNILFLPAVGYRNEITGMLKRVGEHGYYWGSTVNDAYEVSRLAFNITNNYTNTDYSQRRAAFSVRCVAEVPK